jgi:hypothetical protein
MSYLKGYSIKPYAVAPTGVVTFTDGTNNDLNANQQTCEAYGYTYDKASGSCIAYRFNSKLNSAFNNSTNVKRGSANTTERGTRNSVIIGENNTTKGLNENSLIVGSGHEVESGFNNTSVLGGSIAAIQRQSEVAIGGGLAAVWEGSLTANRQMSILKLSGFTTDATPTKLTLQGIKDNSDGKGYINVRCNSIIGFETYITRLEQGGSSGTAGNYSYQNIKGAVHIKEDCEMTFTVGFSRDIARLGSIWGTSEMLETTSGGITSMSIQVTGTTDIEQIWSATVYLHEVSTAGVGF